MPDCGECACKPRGGAMCLCPSSPLPADEMTDSGVWGLFPHTMSFPGQRPPGTLYDVPNPAAP